MRIGVDLHGVHNSVSVCYLLSSRPLYRGRDLFQEGVVVFGIDATDVIDHRSQGLKHLWRCGD